MQEKQVIRSLNWAYYAMMIISLIALTGMYYGLLHDWYMPIDKQSIRFMKLPFFCLRSLLLILLSYKNKCP